MAEELLPKNERSKGTLQSYQRVFIKLLLLFFNGCSLLYANKYIHLLSTNIQIRSLYDTFQLRDIEWTTTRSLSREYNTDILFPSLLKL